LILEQAVRDRASDIHIVPDFDSVRVRYRVDGVLQESLALPRGSHDPLLSRIKILAGMNIAERRRPQDGQFSKHLEGDDIHFRVATSDTTHGEMATLRVLGRSESILDLHGLGLLEGPIEALETLIHLPFGMVLVSGPTGSGKTTTLYAALNQLDRQQLNIMTIEDPVEYNFPRINQIQVNRAAEITFGSGLRGVMRLDPDVIMVGEVRDGETADSATQAALTGHLVLSSIHANDSPSALYRLAHLGVERYMISSAILGVVAQRLVRRICPHCKIPTTATEAEEAAFESEMGESIGKTFRGEGCTYCSHTGYLGRTGVFEILRVDETMRKMFAEGAGAGELRAVALTQGMKTMRQDGMTKVSLGITTPEEVIRNTAWIV
jgi:general secretion pathway protein E